MSAAGDHNTCEVIGTVQAFCRGPGGVIRGFLVQIDTGTPALVPVLSDTRPWLQRGARVFAKGSLQSEPVSGQSYPLVYLLAQWIEVITPKGARPRESSTSET